MSDLDFLGIIIFVNHLATIGECLFSYSRKAILPHEMVLPDWQYYLCVRRSPCGSVCKINSEMAYRFDNPILWIYNSFGPVRFSSGLGQDLYISWHRCIEHTSLYKHRDVQLSERRRFATRQNLKFAHFCYLNLFS